MLYLENILANLKQSGRGLGFNKLLPEVFKGGSLVLTVTLVEILASL